MVKQPAQRVKQKKQAVITVWDQITRIPLVYLLFFAVSFLIYGQALGFYLGKFDEDLLILGNLNILKDLSNLNLAFARDAFLSDKGVSFYRPLQTVTYMIDSQFFMVRGSVFYFTNILIHAATCSALFYLLSLLGKNRKAAFIFTMVFLASPLFVHAIAWAPSRGDLLIGLTGILSLVFFIKMVSTRNYKFGAFSLLSFSAAMFSKETAILIPVLIFLYYLFLEKNRRLPIPSVIILFGGFLLIILLYFYMRFQVVKLPAPPEEFGLAPFFHNLRTLPEYFAKFFIPVHLSPMSGFTTLNTVLGALLVALLVFFIFRFGQKPYTKELFGLAWFLVFVIPGVMYSHKLGSEAYDYLEHRAYLPMAGMVMLLFFIYNDVPDSKIKRNIAGYLLLFAAGLGLFSFFYTKHYENPLIFYNHTIASNPASAMALSNRGLIKAEIKDYKGAIADYEKAVAIKPDYAQAYVNKGVSLATLNDKHGAIAQYETAIRYEPELFQAHFNKANAVSDLGLFDEALKEYTRSLEIYPTYVAGYVARGITYSNLKDFVAASKDFSKAIELDNKNAVAYMNRGKIRYNDNDKTGACADWQSAAGLGNEEARELLSKYCR
ncbi:MAG: tetratricopeptide repeat protein [Bacteroidales bacterium]|nr:tetratricopeptide repeat protein [Bacteroidales bacterium]